MVALLLAASAAAVALTGCAEPVSLKRADIAAARAPIQVQTAARLDLTGLVVLGEVHDARCNVGSDVDPGRDPFEFFCYAREVRVVDLGQVDMAQALAAADRATSAVCGEEVAPLSDPTSAIGHVETLPRAAQLDCGDMTLDVLVGVPGDEYLKSASQFGPPNPKGPAALRASLGLDAASRAGSSYVLCLLGRTEFIRKMR